MYFNTVSRNRSPVKLNEPVGNSFALDVGRMLHTTKSSKADSVILYGALMSHFGMIALECPQWCHLRTLSRLTTMVRF